MRNVIAYILRQGFGTAKQLFPELPGFARGFPKLTGESAGSAKDCQSLASLCPTGAIGVEVNDGEAKLSLDLARCIQCGICIEQCKTGAIVTDRSTTQARRSREALILRQDVVLSDEPSKPTGFEKSIAARVVSTGCAACDLEIGASGNAVFDLERFGVNIVASPRYADVLIVTGPVSKAMHEPLRRAYEAMPEPRMVIALGTCACSGGVHRGGYTEANGVDSVLPVDVYIPGCPPHPWQIIYGIQKARGAV
jgi:Ni,Fe-hydrogenase III small subunit/NAD-dependent dihydropyrimidine dehydrogenase PreA subunit